MPQPTSASKSSIWLAATAAFCTYFCMYAFRKPFTAATFELQPAFIVGFRSAIDESVWTLGFKTLLILSQVSGYMLSKFVGIKVVSEMKPNRRAVSIISLIAVAELALVGFAYVPLGLKPLMLLLNGLPLGMIFGLVLSFLEGRKHTEALSAVLCASFIVSSGAVKSIGQWLIQDMGVPEFKMPMVTGILFFVPHDPSFFLFPSTFCNALRLPTPSTVAFGRNGRR